MKKLTSWTLWGIVLLGLVIGGCVPAGLPIPTPQTNTGGLSNQEIVAGLKEALAVGTTNAVLSASDKDGYWGNQLIRILLPEKVRQYEQPLRLAGLGSQIDAFKLSMNRAAEAAAPKAKELFMNAIRQMSFADAKKILFGSDTAATEFFRDKTEGPLTQVFKPIVHDAMNAVGVTREYQKIQGKLNLITLGQAGDLNLDSYVTGEALDGLFTLVAEEEKKIRNNPVARVTDILKKVFGSR